MMSYMDYTSPNTQFTYDLSNNRFFTKDANNYINSLSVKQLNTLGNSALLDIFLQAGNVVEPHYHQNASELVYCITGAAIVSLINPFTNELLQYPISPGQVANVPQGWWHYEVASTNNTHLLAIFDAPEPEVILGSDLLRLTPPDVLAHTYCLDRKQVKDTLAPIQKSVFIGPPSDCSSVKGTAESNAAKKPYLNSPIPNQQRNQAVPGPANSRQTYAPYLRQQPVYSPYPHIQHTYPQY